MPPHFFPSSIQTSSPRVSLANDEVEDNILGRSRGFSSRISDTKFEEFALLDHVIFIPIYSFYLVHLKKFLNHAAFQSGGIRIYNALSFTMTSCTVSSNSTSSSVRYLDDDED